MAKGAGRKHQHVNPVVNYGSGKELPDEAAYSNEPLTQEQRQNNKKRKKNQ